MQWFKWYEGTVNDPKITLVVRKSGQPRIAVIAVWAAILEEASASAERGVVGTIDPEVIGAALDFDEEAVASIVQAFEDKGLIQDGEVAAWGKRQFVSDCSTERVRRFRERAKRDETDETVSETVGNAGNDRKKEREKERDNPPVVPQGGRTKGSRLLLEACPDDWMGWARENGHGDPAKEFDRFRDYWTAQPGQKGVKADWLATWRNWIRRTVDDGKAPVVAERAKPTGPRRMVAMRFGEGDLSSLRARLRSGMGSAWKVYLETLVPESGGGTYGPCPPDEVLADVKKWADYYDIPCEWEVAHDDYESRQLGRRHAYQTTGFWDSSWGPQPEAA